MWFLPVLYLIKFETAGFLLLGLPLRGEDYEAIVKL